MTLDQLNAIKKLHNTGSVFDHAKIVAAEAEYALTGDFWGLGSAIDPLTVPDLVAVESDPLPVIPLVPVPEANAANDAAQNEMVALAANMRELDAPVQAETAAEIAAKTVTEDGT